MYFFYEQFSNVRNPGHLHNEILFDNIDSKYITMRSHRLLGPSIYFIMIVLLHNIRDKSRLSLYKVVNNSQFLKVNNTFNYMYVEHMMCQSAKALYSNGHLRRYHISQLIFVLITSNTLPTWQTN